MKKLIKLKRLNEKGLTLVEVMISVTIFAIMVVPIMSQLNTLLKSNYTAKLSQAETDFATREMEHFKELNKDTIALVKDASGNDDIHGGIGRTKEGYTVDVSDPDAYIYTKNNIKLEKDMDAAGKTLLRNGVTYSVDVKLDAAAYATSTGTNANPGAGGSTEYAYTDPNSADDYNLENLDDRFAILLKDNVSNYDNRAADDLMDKIALKLKSDDPNLYGQWLAGADVLQSLGYVKNTKITYEKGISKEEKYLNKSCYLVTVQITYIDNMYHQKVTYTLMDKKEYHPEQTDGVPPSIYYFYNQYVQDNMVVSGTDTVTIDNSGCSDKEKDAIKCYIVRGKADSEGEYTYYVRKNEAEGGGDEKVGLTTTQNVAGSYVYKIEQNGAVMYQWPSFVTDTRDDSKYGSTPMIVQDENGDEKYIYDNVVTDVAPSLTLYTQKTGVGYYSYIRKEDGTDNTGGTEKVMKAKSIVYQRANRQYVWPDGTVTAQAPNTTDYYIGTPSKITYRDSAKLNILVGAGSKTELNGKKMIRIYSNIEQSGLSSTLAPATSARRQVTYSSSEYNTIDCSTLVEGLKGDKKSSKKRLYHIVLKLYRVENGNRKLVMTLQSGKEG